MKRKHKRYFNIFLVLLALVLFLIIIVLMYARIINFVESSGRIKYFHKIAVTANTDGIIESSGILEGDTVSSGGILCKLNNQKIITTLNSLELSKKETLIKLEERNYLLNTQLNEINIKIYDYNNQLLDLDNDINALKFESYNEEIKQFSDDVERNKILFSAGAISEVDFNNSLSKLTIKKIDRDFVKAQREALMEKKKNISYLIEELKNNKSNLYKTSENEIEQLRINISSIELSILETKNDIQTLNIISPVSGIVIFTNNQIGKYIARGDEIFTIADPNNLVIESDVPEKELLKIKTKQTVRLIFPSIPQSKYRKYTGYVDKIDAKSLNYNGRQLVKMLIAPKEDLPIGLKDNMEVNVKIIIDQDKPLWEYIKDEIIKKRNILEDEMQFITFN